MFQLIDAIHTFKEGNLSLLVTYIDERIDWEFNVERNDLN